MGLIEQGVIGYLDAGQLEKWRQTSAVVDALGANPEAFSMKESIRAYFDLYVFLGGLYPDYGIERKRDIWVSTNSGAITYLDDLDEDDA